MTNPDPYILQPANGLVRHGKIQAMLWRLTHLTGLIVAVLYGSYFFENLPMEMKVAAIERLHPGQKCFYQNGIVHNLLGNFECNVLHVGEHYPIDAADIYRSFRLGSAGAKSELRDLIRQDGKGRILSVDYKEPTGLPDRWTWEPMPQRTDQGWSWNPLPYPKFALNPMTDRHN